MLGACLFMLAAISITRDGKILGHSLEDAAATGSAPDTAPMSRDGRLTILNTASTAKDIVGYGGPIPLKIYLDGQRIDHIEVGRNAETADFMKRVEQDVIAAYTGKSVDEALAMHVDAVSGATLSSTAVIATLQRALATAAAAKAPGGAANTGRPFGAAQAAALAVAFAAALLPLFIKNRRYRTLQLVLNVAVTGLWAGKFVSFSALASLLSNGPSWQHAALLVLLAVAFLYPLAGRRGHYCAWCCPLGSAQELAGRIKKKKLALPPRLARALTAFRRLLWAALMLCAWTGLWAGWMDYELFAAFVLQSVSWLLGTLAIVVLVLAVFVPRPYCRFLCPTGTLLRLM